MGSFPETYDSQQLSSKFNPFTLEKVCRQHVLTSSTPMKNGMQGQLFLVLLKYNDLPKGV